MWTLTSTPTSVCAEMGFSEETAKTVSNCKIFHLIKKTKCSEWASV